MKPILVASVLLAACGSSAPKITTPTGDSKAAPAVRPNSIVVSGTRNGAAFSFACDRPGHELGAPTSVANLDTSILVACADEASGLVANCTVHKAVGDQPLTDDESTGRINLNFQPPGSDDGFEQITTSASGAVGSARGMGMTKITAWDAKAGHIVGTSTMKWEKGKTGAAGTLTIAFDVTAPGQ
jgi:hypothetical protein